MKPTRRTFLVGIAAAGALAALPSPATAQSVEPVGNWACGSFAVGDAPGLNLDEVFTDGFESGGTDAWDAVVGGA